MIIAPLWTSRLRCDSNAALVVRALANGAAPAYPARAHLTLAGEVSTACLGTEPTTGSNIRPAGRWPRAGAGVCRQDRGSPRGGCCEAPATRPITAAGRSTARNRPHNAPPVVTACLLPATLRLEYQKGECLLLLDINKASLS